MDLNVAGAATAPVVAPVPPTVEQLAAKLAEAEKKLAALSAPPVPFWKGILDDIHTNASGLVFFTCIAVGIIWPEDATKCDKLATAAGIYLFGAAKNKINSP